MSRSKVYFGLIFCGLILATFYWKSLGLKPATLANGASFTPEECWFNHIDSVRVECGHLTTRSSNSDTPSFKLPVVVLRHSWWKNSQSPMLHLSGGPGGAAYLDNQSMVFQITNFITQGWGIDFVLYDQRGTGLSEPGLFCDDTSTARRQSLSQNLSAKEESDEYSASLETCLNKLSNDSDTEQHLKYVSTDYSVDDIADLHDLLGVEQWVLMGTSYGTRLALESARSIPEKVKSMVLDSVYPPEFNGIETLVESTFDTFQAVFSFCKKNDVCNQNYPDLDADFTKALNSLAKEPWYLEAPSSDEDSTEWTFALNAERFINLLTYAGYDASLLGDIPAAIQAVVNDEKDAESIQRLLENFLEVDLSDGFSEPVYMLTECLENDDFDKPAYAQKLALYQAQYPMLDLSFDTSYDPEMCAGWRALATSKERDFRAVVKSDIPTLVLAGGLDSVTPASWGRELVKWLPNATYLEYPNLAHAVLYSSLCANDEVQQFLNPELKETQFCDAEDRIFDLTNKDFGSGL